MKTFTQTLIPVFILVFLLAFAGLTGAQNKYISIYGHLKDTKTGEDITYATIRIPGTSVGTVSNSEGEFLLKVDTALHAEFFEVSHVSYSTTKFSISEALGKDKVFYLKIQPISLKEVSVKADDARTIVENALGNVKKNYSNEPNMMTAFYREFIRQRHEYQSIAEAVVDIYKSSYTGMMGDQVKIYKGRKGSNVKKADTILVHLEGGPNVTLSLDIMKNMYLFLHFNNLNDYHFEISTISSIDDKPVWVISFSPAIVKDWPLYFGKLYITKDSYAITRAEFSLDLSNPWKASDFYVEKKPASVIFNPTSTSYLVTYKEQGGKYYLNYLRIDLKFRCDWKRKLFRNSYTMMSEMAITDRSEENTDRFASGEVFRPTMIFTDKISAFQDVDFWGPSNIIEPESSIEKAVESIGKGKNN